MAWMAVVRQRWFRYVVVAVVVLAAGGVAAGVLIDRARMRTELAAIRDPDPKVRHKALYNARRTSHQPVIDAIIEALRTDEDREVLRMAGYAAMYLRDPRGLELMLKHVESGPDDLARADFLAYIARYPGAGDSCRAVFDNALASTEPWRRVGAAAGLLELGDVRGGPVLIEIGRQAEPALSRYAVDYLERIAGPMAEAVGQRIDWPTPERPAIDEAWWDRMSEFWAGFATERLLNDVLDRRYRRDGKWKEIDRLLNARDRVALWLQ